MKKLFARAASAVLAVYVTSGVALAQSAKAVAADSTLAVCTAGSSGTTSPVGDFSFLGLNCTISNVTGTGIVVTGTPVPIDATNWYEIMTVPVHLSSSQSLFVTPSIVTGLYTNTKATGSSSSTAIGKVLLRVVMDAGTNKAVVAEPVADCSNTIFGCGTPDGGSTYGVAFDERLQTLTTSIGSTESVQLILATANGHSFGFIFPSSEVTNGNHTITVEVAVEATASGLSALSAAGFGLGDVAVETVQFTQGSNQLQL